MSFRSKLLTSLLITGGIPVLTLVWFSERIVVRAERNHTIQNLEEAAALQAFRIRDSFLADRDKLALVNSRTQLRISLAAHLQEPDPTHLGKINAIIEDARRSVATFRRITIISPEGKIVATSTNLNPGENYQIHEETFRAALNEEIGQAFRILEGNDGISIVVKVLSAPLKWNGTLIGVSEVLADTGDIKTVLSSHTGFEESGGARLVSREGGLGKRVLVPLGPPGRGSGITDQNGNDLLDLASAKSSHEGIDIASSTRVFAVRSPVEGMPLEIITTMDKDVALAGVKHMRRLGLIIMAGGALAIAVLGVVFSLLFTKPLRELTDTSISILNGNLKKRADIQSKDEIGALADNFNRMAQSLVDSNKLLEEKVRQRTEELASTRILLVQSEKMESIGRMAAGIAHEVKNPLAILQMGLESIKAKLLATPDPLDEETPFVIDQMEDAIRRADQILKGMLEAARDDGLELVPEDLNDIVRKALVFETHSINKKGIQVVEQLSETLPLVECSRGKLQQVIVNLVENAAYAMPDFGKLTIRTYATILRDVVRDEGIRHFDQLRSTDQVAVIEIHNEGDHIAASDLRRIFDPFYTTKPTGEGTGLGLAVCRTIIELHYGQLTIENTDDPRGIRARIFLRITAPKGNREE